MTILQWVDVLKRIDRNHRYKFHRSSFPFAPVVPYQQFEKDLTLLEKRSRKILEPAILCYHERLRWPPMEIAQMYFLRERIADAARAAAPLIAADGKFVVLKDVELSELMQWGLIECWNRNGVWHWMNGLKERWEFLLEHSWMGWLRPIWIEGERKLRAEFTIQKCSVKLLPNARPEHRGLQVFRCVLTLRAGTKCWVDYHSVKEPTHSELHRVMVELPQFMHDYESDPPDDKWHPRNLASTDENHD